MSNDANWTAHLRCGHDAPLQGQPEVGGWITCLDPRCQSQERIVAVTQVSRWGVPGAGETGVQEPLFELGAPERAA